MTRIRIGADTEREAINLFCRVENGIQFGIVVHLHLLVHLHVFVPGSHIREQLLDRGGQVCPLLQQDIETIRRLDEEMSKLQEKMMPGDTMTMDPSMQDGMTVDGSMAMMEDDTAPKFPAFEGMDLDGNAVTSELFKDNSVTVINFWFSGCAPCIGELGELNTLNETLKLRGGAVIGVNTDTLGGDKRMINEAKKLLEKKGAAYQNIYFPSDSAAGDFAGDIMAFPTTYVIDRSGAIVGEAMLGGIDNEDNMAALQKLIDQALANDSAK